MTDFLGDLLGGGELLTGGRTKAHGPAGQLRRRVEVPRRIDPRSDVDGEDIADDDRSFLGGRDRPVNGDLREGGRCEGEQDGDCEESFA